MSIFSQIEALAHEQQNLWREARHKRLKDEQLDRLHVIQRELPNLWHLHRCDLAAGERNAWRQEAKSRGHSPNALHWVKGELDHFSINDMQYMLRIEYKRLKKQGLSQFDQEWAAERQRLNQVVNREIESELAANRQTRRAVSQIVQPKPMVQPVPTFNPHEMSLRQLRDYRRQVSRASAFAGTL